MVALFQIPILNIDVRLKIYHFLSSQRKTVMKNVVQCYYHVTMSVIEK